MAVDFVAVEGHIKTEPANNLSLYVFQFATIKFNDLAATQTDEMIVMRDVHVVFRVSVGKLPFHSHSCLNEKLQGAVDCRGIDPLPFAAQALV